MSPYATPGASGAARVAAPIYLLLFPIPVVCFLAAVATDIVYANSAFLLWLHFSEWLIAAGLAFGALALLALVVEFIADRAIRAGIGWAHALLFCAALVVELFDALVHSIDGWTAVVPTGMALSVVGALLALAAVATLFRVPVAWVAHREVRRAEVVRAELRRDDVRHGEPRPGELRPGDLRPGEIGPREIRPGEVRP
jgi:uncharacterized membrane protein